MKKFDTLVENYWSAILEQEAPMAAPAPDASAAAAPMLDAPAGGGSMGGGAPNMAMGDQEQQQPEGDMDNETKRDTDPRAYTRSILALLVDNKEGVTPEMFDDFIDSVSLAATKVKDAKGLKQFYVDFYQKLELVLSVREELKSKFKQLTGILDDLAGAAEEPDKAGGGAGRAGPSGPGVK